MRTEFCVPFFSTHRIDGDQGKGGFRIAANRPRLNLVARISGPVNTLAPAVITLLLSFPVLSFRFISDDFNILIRAWHLKLHELLPDPRSLFYRPISRELYFAGLAAVGRSNPLWGHVANALLALAITILVTSLARRLAGRRTALFAGILFAGMGALPTLVGWVSGAQDLLAMLFTIVALHLQISRRTGWALASFAIALLCKESALFFLPALALAGPLLGYEGRPIGRALLPHAALGSVWLLGHPLLRNFFTRVPGGGSYVGLDAGRGAYYVLRELAAAINIPIGAHTMDWPSGIDLFAGIAVAVAIVAIWMQSHVEAGDEDVRPRSMRVLYLAALIGIVPGVLTAVTGRHWFPYYACFPAIGTSLLLAMGLVKLRSPFPLVAVLVFIVLGVSLRGADFGTLLTPSERNLGALSTNLGRVERELKKLHSTFPDSSRLYMSVQSPESLYLQHHILNLKAPRVWYSNMTIETADPSRYKEASGPEYLFWVSKEGDVFEVVLDGLRVRSPGPRPDIRDYQKALRSLAFGYFTSRETDKAASLLLNMREIDSLTWAFDCRLAATMLIASGRSGDAHQILRQMPAIQHEGSLYAVAAVLGPNLPGFELDHAAFKAFGVSETDPEAYRFLMNLFVRQSQMIQAMRMAQRLTELVPGDREASATMDAIRRIPKWDEVVSPVDSTTIN